MATECDRCGKESYVIYVKSNPGNICDECEDAERRIKGMPGNWDTISKNNQQHNYHQNNKRPFEKVLNLNSYREFACESKTYSRLFKNTCRSVRSSTSS
jgi:hypothetical protein